MTRVDDLAGAELALWVARAGGAVDADIHWRSNRKSFWMEDYSYGFQPHEDWAQGGPLIEKHLISVEYGHGGDQPWRAEIGFVHNLTDGVTVYGPTALIAAMRALVASVYGEEVTP